jgi:co-chaperonin GroES (HSP10)
MKETKFRPLHDDIMMYLKPANEVLGTSIVFQESKDAPTQFFNVFAVGPECKEIKVGDVVVVPWTRVTVPQKEYIHGEYRNIGVTSEKEVLAIVES